MSNLKSQISNLILVSLVLILLMPVSVHAATPTPIVTQTILSDPYVALRELIRLGAIFLSWSIFLGIIFCILMVIIGGFKIMVAGEDPEAAAAGRNTVTYAIVGLVLLCSVYLVMKILVEIIPGLEKFVTIPI